MVKTRFIASAALLIFSAACSQSSSPSTTASATGPTEIVLPLRFGTHMHGGENLPVRDTNATGQLNLKLSKDGQSIEYTLIAANIDNVFASHIHAGSVDVASGPIVVGLYSGPVASGRHNGVLATGTIRATNLVGPLKDQPLSALIDLIESGNAYANVHTNDGVNPADTGPGDFPSGEIRGQVRK